MGIKDWLAGVVAGPRAYGQALGRETVMEAGRGIANSAFFNHGSCGKTTGVSVSSQIFDTVSQMEDCGFKLRYADTFQIDPASLPPNEQILCKSLHIALIPFAYLVVSDIALAIMREDNATKFCDGLTDSASKAMKVCGLHEDSSAARNTLTAARGSYAASGVPTILDGARGDFLEYTIVNCANITASNSQYAFVRQGAVDLMTIPMVLLEETMKSVFAASANYNW